MPIKFVPFKSTRHFGDLYVGFSSLFLARDKIVKTHAFIVT